MSAMKAMRGIALLACLTVTFCGPACALSVRASDATTVRLHHRDAVTAVGFTPDGKRLLTGAGGRRRASVIHTWDPATGEWLRGWPSDTGLVEAITVAAPAKGPWLVVSSHQSETAHWLNVWDGKAEGVLRQIPLPANSVRSAQLSADGKTIAVDSSNSADEHSLRFFDVGTSREVQLVPEGVTGCLIGVTPDFQKLLTADGQSLRLWDGGRDKVLVQQVADGVPPGSLRLGDAGRAELLQVFPSPGRMIRQAALSNGARTLLTLDAGAALVAWDTENGRELRKWQWEAAESPVWAALSPDGRRVAAVGRRGTGVVWDLATGWRLLDFRIPRAHPGALALSPDGRMLAAVTDGSTVQVYHITPGRRGGGLAAKDLEALWKALTGEGQEAPAAHRAAFALADAPKEAVPFLRQRLRPPDAADRRKVTQLIADLDSDDVARRDAAFNELLKLGMPAEAPLRRALKEAPSAEARLRIVSLLKAAEASAQLRPARALRVLELIGNDEARQALAALREGQEDTWLGREAKAALDRLTARPEGK